MSLIACPDCSTSVSDAAPACPKCGRPIAATTIEQTGKNVKGAQLLGAMLTIGGCVTTVANVGNPPASSALVAGYLVMMAGLVIFIWARLLAWWEHG
jgi:Flp pilus assembly protein TadB